MEGGVNKQWTPEDDALLRDYSERGYSFGDAAWTLGVTRNMVAGRAQRLGIRFGGQSSIPWSAKDDAALVALAALGLSGREIARQLLRTEAAVRLRLHERGTGLRKLRAEAA